MCYFCVGTNAWLVTPAFYLIFKGLLQSVYVCSLAEQPNKIVKQLIFILGFKTKFGLWKHVPFYDIQNEQVF